MKIVGALFFLFCLTLPVWAEDCKYLLEQRWSTLSPESEAYNQRFAFELCTANTLFENHTDAYTTIADIKKNASQPLVDQIRGIGETFCRGSFGKCGSATYDIGPFVLSWQTLTEEQKSKVKAMPLYYRFLKACNQAIENTKKSLQWVDQVESIDLEMLGFSIANTRNARTGCQDLAVQYIASYKEVAMQEVVRVYSEQLQASTDTYMIQSQQWFNYVSWLWNKFILELGKIAKSFQGFTKFIHLPYMPSASPTRNAPPIPGTMEA